MVGGRCMACVACAVGRHTVGVGSVGNVTHLCSRSPCIVAKCLLRGCLE